MQIYMCVRKHSLHFTSRSFHFFFCCSPNKGGLFYTIEDLFVWPIVPSNEPFRGTKERWDLRLDLRDTMEAYFLTFRTRTYRSPMRWCIPVDPLWTVFPHSGYQPSRWGWFLNLILASLHSLCLQHFLSLPSNSNKSGCFTAVQSLQSTVVASTEKL